MLEYCILGVYPLQRTAYISLTSTALRGFNEPKDRALLVIFNLSLESSNMSCNREDYSITLMQCNTF